jgi:hypothetical protein
VRPARGRSDSMGDVMAYPVETPTIVNAIPFRGDHRPAAQVTAYPPADYQDAFLQNGFAAHYIRESRQTPDIGQQQPPRGGMAPNPFTAPPLLATEPMDDAAEQERNFRTLLNQGFGAAPAAQAYASVGGTGVPPSFAFGGPQVHTPGPPLRQGNPSPQGAEMLNPRFYSPAVVTPAGAVFNSPAYAPLPREPPPINSNPWTSIQTVEFEGRGDWSFKERANGATLVLKHNGVGNHERDLRAEGGIVEQTHRREDRYLASLPDRTTSSKSSGTDARDIDPAARRDNFDRHLDLLPPGKRQRLGLSTREEGSPLMTGGAGLRCARCYAVGHQPIDCPLNMHCEYCGGNNHITADCPRTERRYK